MSDGSPRRASEDDPTGAETATDQFRRWRDDTRERLREAQTARVDVYVRSMLPPPGAKESQQRLIRELHEAVTDAPIDDVLVEVWGERLCRCEACRQTSVGRRLLDRIDVIESWGEEYDASARPFFERTHQESAVTGSSYEGLVPPRVTAVLYVEGAVAGVFPSRFGTDHLSVDVFVECVRRMTEPVEVTGSVEPSR